MYDFTTIVDRRKTESVKWDPKVIEQLTGNAEALPYWVADMDFRSPPEVIEALQQRIEHGIFGYPSPSASRQALSAFCSWVGKRYQWQLESSQVVYSPGLISTLSILVSLLTAPDEKVIIQTPAYRPFFTIVSENDRTCLENPMLYDTEQHRYTIDYDQLTELARDPKTRLLIFCSPHNPAGRVWSEDEIRRVYEICEKWGVSVISDEIHADLCYRGVTHTPFSRVQRPESSIDIITCMAPSKTFNIAGEHFSCTVIPDKKTRVSFQKELRRLSISSPGILAMTAATAAYTQGEQWLDELLEVLADHADLIDRYIREQIPALHLVRPEASFIAFIDCTEMLTGLERMGFKGTVAEFFARKAGVALHDGLWFGGEGNGFVRINFGAPTELVRSALDAMKKAVNTLDLS
jgi:cystathionine beta-lyase